MRFTWPGPLSVSHVWWDHSPSMSIHGYSKEIEYGNAVINKHTLNCSTKNVSVRILYLHHCHHHYPCIIMNISIINHYMYCFHFPCSYCCDYTDFHMFISNHQILNDCAWQCVTVTSENWCWSTVSESGIGVSHIHSRNPGYNGSTRKKLGKFLSVLEWIVDALDFHGEFAIWHSGGKVTKLQLAQWLCFNMKSYEVLQKHIRHHDGTKAFCLLSSTLQDEWRPGASTKRVSKGNMVTWWIKYAPNFFPFRCCSIFTSSKAPPALHGRRQWPKACQLGLPPQGSWGDTPTSETHVSCLH